MKHIAIVFVLLCLAAGAHAAVIAQESWNYGDGSATSVVGQTGGTGFENSSGWQINADATNVYKAEVLNPGTALSYTSGDSSISVDGGNRALRLSEGAGLTYKQTVDRSLATAIDPGTTNEVFVSFLMRLEADTDHNHDWFGSGMNNNTGKGSVYVKNDSWTATPSTWGDTPVSVTEVPVAGHTYLVVARFYADATAANWESTNPLFNRGEIWIDPNAGDAGTPDAVSLYTSSGLEENRSLGIISSLTMVSERLDLTDAAWYDEFTLGTTWGDVIPEPTTMVLMSIGGLALIRRRK